MRSVKPVLVTGGFDPIHAGHIAYFTAARKLGDKLIVGLNSDKWLTRKKGKAFQTWEERKIILENLKMVSEVISFDDNDDTANNAIYKILSQYDRIILANGGDRTKETTPEYKVYGNTPWVRFEFGVGGEDKINSSSSILKEWTDSV